MKTPFLRSYKEVKIKAVIDSCEDIEKLELVREWLRRIQIDLESKYDLQLYLYERMRIFSNHSNLPPRFAHRVFLTGGKR